jgi:hypothetical protein
LHKKYGPQLTAAKPRLQQSGNEEDVNGVLVDTSLPSSFALGMVNGLQVSQKSNGKCFYVTMDTIDFIDTLRQDVDNAINNFQWYNLVVIDSLHLNGNILALTE